MGLPPPEPRLEKWMNGRTGPVPCRRRDAAQTRNQSSADPKCSLDRSLAKSDYYRDSACGSEARARPTDRRRPCQRPRATENEPKAPSLTHRK